MKALLKMLGLVALLCVLTLSGGCVLEEKVLEIVLSGETCADFEEDHDSGNFSSESVLAYGDEIQDILDDNGIDREDIADAFVMGGSYEVTDFSHTHDWTVAGSILVERMGSGADPDTLLRYTDQSIEGALNNRIWAELHQDGVDVLNQALDDFLGGQTPVIKFTLANGTTTPEPSAFDRIAFVWQTCIKIHLVYVEIFDFPDI